MSIEERSERNPLQSLFAGILEAQNRGIPVDRDALLKRHPEHADSLREFFASHEQMKSVGDVVPPTLPPPSSETESPPAGVTTPSPTERVSDNVNVSAVGEPPSNDDPIEFSHEQQKPSKFLVKCCMALAVITAITILFEVARVTLSPFPETFQWSMIVIQMLLFVAIVVVVKCKVFVSVRYSAVTAIVAAAILNVGTRWAAGTLVYQLTIDISEVVFVIAAILALPASLRFIAAVDRDLSESARITAGLTIMSVAFFVIGCVSMRGAGMYFVGAFLVPWGLLSAVLMLSAVIHAVNSSLKKK